MHITPTLSMTSWTAPIPDMIYVYWLKKLTALHEHLVAQMNQLLTDGTHPEWPDSLDSEGFPEGGNAIKLLAYTIPHQIMEATVLQYSG